MAESPSNVEASSASSRPAEPATPSRPPGVEKVDSLEQCGGVVDGALESVRVRGAGSQGAALDAGVGVLAGLELHTASPSRDRDATSDRGDGPVLESTSVGEILETLTLGDDRYVLVDSRHWTQGSRRLVPVAALDRIDMAGRRCDTSLSRDCIRRAPDFDPFRLASDRYRRVLQNYFASELRRREKTEA